MGPTVSFPSYGNQHAHTSNIVPMVFKVLLLREVRTKIISYDCGKETWIRFNTIQFVEDARFTIHNDVHKDSVQQESDVHYLPRRQRRCYGSYHILESDSYHKFGLICFK
jgi:hypothetical protein